MKQTQDDFDADYWLTKRAEISLSTSEQRSRNLAAIAAMEETKMHPVIKSDEYSFWMCLGSLATGALTVLLLFLVIMHRVYLPDATVMPMGVAAMICAVACAVTGWLGVRGLA